MPVAAPSTTVELIAVLAAVSNSMPLVMPISDGEALPSGPLVLEHRSLQAGLRSWVEQQTRLPVGYLEQLYTFADRDRDEEGDDRRFISISYLGLTRAGETEGRWQSWYDYFPWEDSRKGRPAVIDDLIRPALQHWLAKLPKERRQQQRQRVELAFSQDARSWNEEFILQRFELLYEAGLVAERLRVTKSGQQNTALGRPMRYDHRRILATAIARLRAKIKYRPVVFELLPPEFTLLQLQRSVEAIGGKLVHKQNFRRLVEQQELVEETGSSTVEGRGRPAKLFRFRRHVLEERAVAGTKLPAIRP